MRILITPAQHKLIESHPRIRALATDLRYSAVSFNVEDSDTFEELLANLAPIDGKVAANLTRKIVDAAELFADDLTAPETPSPATEPATPSPTTPDPSQPVTEDVSAYLAHDYFGRNLHALPVSTAVAVRQVADGEYGTRASSLARTMDDRNGERMTRWVARLRHKLTSAGLKDAADSLRLTPAII